MAYSLRVVGRYQSDPVETHWKVVKTILKYLKNTKDHWLVYGESDLRLIGFTNSSFQSDHDDRKSVSGFIFTLNSEAVCWKSSKQHTVADSVCEAEYDATSDAAKKAVWLKKFITKLEVAPSLVGPVLLYCDALEPLLRRRNRRHTSGRSIFYAATISSRKSWIKMTSTFERSTKRRTWPT